jgi:hypothetical protein
MTEYARWWQRRERFAWTARLSSAGLEIQAKKSAEDLTVIVEQDGRYSASPAATGTYPLTTLARHALPEPVRFDPRALAARKPSLLLLARTLNRKARKTLRGHRG